MSRGEILEKLQGYGEFVKIFAKNGLLEPEEVEVLRKFSII